MSASVDEAMDIRLAEHHEQEDDAVRAQEKAERQTRSLAIDACQALHELVTEYRAILEDSNIVSFDDDTLSILGVMKQIKTKWRV